MSFKRLCPASDFMILKKNEKKGLIKLVGQQPNNTIVFEILAIGPGYWQNGTFIKTTYQVGDMVFLVGNIAELEHDGIVYTMGQERSVVARLDK